MEIAVVPLTPERWPDFEALFGPNGACAGCWCTYFRMRPKERQAGDAAARRAFIRERIAAGPPPGMLAYAGPEAVGWLQIGPRADVPEWNNRGRASAPLEDGPAEDPSVWAASCFFARAKVRGQGLSHRLLAGGIAFARAAGARLLEACPMDRAKQAKSVGLYVGSTAVFLRAGFREVARRKPGRPLMRLEL
ncbi:MAG TPA: GNAT family N-acetyltransferase [Paracoccaceae bacterium]|nr:GNAT family N-acetyltransferase [Paracoccaceae bacterium]